MDIYKGEAKHLSENDFTNALVKPMIFCGKAGFFSDNIISFSEVRK